MSDNQQNNFTSLIKFEIFDKKMKVFLEVKEPDAEQEGQITSQDILNFLAKEGIVFGIKNDVIDEIINGNKWGERFLVAEGVNPTTGDDAKIEFCFPTDRSFKPQISEDGRIDYHEISIVNSVAKDDILIKKTLATPGIRGKDVLGNEIAPIVGKDINISTGSGVYRDTTDPTLIKASTDGIIFYDPNKNSVEVQKLFLVKESVDFSTGNVNVKSSVEIKGDVNPGFSVKTPYNIQIGGTAEQAIIACDGTLKVKKGIVGDGKQHIYAGGDIHAGYINNQNIKCLGSLYVATEIRNSNIICGGEIVLVKGDGVILGGKAFATNKLTSAVIGNRYNVPTEVEVGITLEFKEKHDIKKAEMAAVHKTIANFHKNIAEVSKMLQSESKDQRLISLNEECEACVKQLDRIKKEISDIEKLGAGSESPSVCVSKTVYPGVTVRIRHAVYEVKEELSNVKFSLVDDEITCTKLR